MANTGKTFRDFCVNRLPDNIATVVFDFRQKMKRSELNKRIHFQKRNRTDSVCNYINPANGTPKRST